MLFSSIFQIFKNVTL